MEAARRNSLSPGATPKRVLKQTEFSLFIQDEWNLRPNLTLSLGLRYDTQGNVQRGFYLAPRIAFAYAPGVAAGGRPKTVIRGGFGIFFDRFSESLLLQANHFNEANLQQFITTDPNILRMFPAVPSLALLETSAATPTSVQVAPNLQLPYMMQGAINVERQLPLKICPYGDFPKRAGASSPALAQHQCSAAGNVPAVSTCRERSPSG